MNHGADLQGRPAPRRRTRSLPPFLDAETLPEAARIWIYGAGSRGLAFLQRCRSLRPDVEVLGFADRRAGELEEGHRVRSATELARDRTPGDLVLVASEAWVEIVNGLRRDGAPSVAVALVPRKPGYRSAVVLEPLRAIYLVMHKVACKSVQGALLDALGDRAPESARRFRVVDLRSPQYTGWLRFTFVRNPWDRLVSCYENKLAHHRSPQVEARFARPLSELLGVPRPTFPEFARFVAQHPDAAANAHWRSQSNSIWDADGTCLVDRVGRFERLEADFADVARELGIAASLPSLNAARERWTGHREYFSASLRDRVGRRYRRDIERFEYEF